MTGRGRRPLVVGNWKMNLDREEAVRLAATVAAGAPDGVDILLAPPSPYMERVAGVLRGTRVGLAGQNLHWESCGAFTGEISGVMLADVGATHVLVGHSERRQACGEDDETVRRKAAAARRAGLMPIVCAGESLAHREAGRAAEVVLAQLAAGTRGIEGYIVAYEPVWAIGTGEVARPDQAGEMHRAIKKALGEDVPVLYGGSVTPGNTARLSAEPGVDGLLVGGASLEAEAFLEVTRLAGRVS